MKKQYLLLLLPAILCLSCTKVFDCTASGGGDNVEFTYKVAKQIFPCSGGLTATVTLIEDSRCPADVACSLAGGVKVTLMAGDIAVTLAKGYSADAVSADADYKGHKLRFTLLDVTPYPLFHNPAQDGDKKILISIVQR